MARANVCAQYGECNRCGQKIMRYVPTQMWMLYNGNERCTTNPDGFHVLAPSVDWAKRITQYMEGEKWKMSASQTRRHRISKVGSTKNTCG